MTTKLIYLLILIYFLTTIEFKPRGSCKYMLKHKQYTKQYNETEYNTYIKIKIHKGTLIT